MSGLLSQVLLILAENKIDDMRRITLLTALAFLAFSLFAQVPESGSGFKVKAMYVDFRTQVHTVEAIKALAKQVAEKGMNTLIFEYEATFPFEKHATLKNNYAFTKDEIRDLVSYCEGLGLDVIPLQNCMGHMQYLLQHERYAALREDPKDVSQVCPLRIGEAVPIFKEIFSEVAALHPSRYFHIGCDETFLLGSCAECSAYAAKYGKSKLFVEYVKAMCEIVHEMGKTPVIWADIILKHPENLSELPDDLVYMDWNYGWNVNQFGPLSNLTEANKTIWGASALRSYPDDLFLTQWMKHFNNLRDFVPFARKSGYAGMVQTSWSTSGIYSYVYGTGNEILRLVPNRSVYPESGFNILIEATAWAYNHDEALDPESFVRAYAKNQYGFNEEDAGALWSYFTMPQEVVSVRNGKDAKGTPIPELIATAQQMRARLAALSPKSHKQEIAHLLLMLDIRINYLEFKQCESEFESGSYDGTTQKALAERMTRICKSGREIDKRLWRLNKHYLKPGEIHYLASLRGDKMNAFLKSLNDDPS